MPSRRNMDESLRRLERAALRGDPRAGQALVVAWGRAGLPPELALLVRRVWSLPGKLPGPDAAVAIASRILERPLSPLEDLAVRGSLWNEAIAERVYQQENPRRHRNADDDLRSLERIANATRAPGDIQRYEVAAARAGLRRLVSVDELVPTVKWPRAVAGMRWHRGLALGKPVQVETVGEVLELVPAAADQGGQRGLKRFWCPSRASWFGTPVGNDPTSAYAGAWGRAVDPLESYLHRDVDGSERSWLTVPVAVPGLSGVRLMATHIWLWDRLPPWANDVPRVVRTLRPTGEMTGFLDDDPVVPGHGRPRRNVDERLRRLERAAATGDDDARRLLEIERQRAGILTLSDYSANFDDFVTVVQQLLGDRLGFDAKARARIQRTPLPIRLRPVSDFLPQAQREASGGWKDDRGDDYFEDMKRAIADGVRLPPVVSRGGFLVDGFHRVLAYADLGLTEIEAFDLGEWAELAMA